jgi:hypothetical protein
MIYDLRFTIFKGTAVICLFFFLITTNTFAQEKGFRGGILFGAVASQVDGDALSGFYKGGLQSGIFLTNRFNKKSGIQIELKFIQKGSRTVWAPSDSAAPVNPNTDRYYKLRLNYVEVPFLYNFYLNKKFMLETGLGFAYLFNAKEDVDGYGFLDPNPPFRKFDFPVYFGVTYFPFEKFHLDFRYSYSTVAIRPHPAHQTWYFDRGQYNNLLSFGMYLNI